MRRVIWFLRNPTAHIFVESTIQLLRVLYTGWAMHVIFLFELLCRTQLIRLFPLRTRVLSRSYRKTRPVSCRSPRVRTAWLCGTACIPAHSRKTRWIRQESFLLGATPLQYGINEREKRAWQNPVIIYTGYIHFRIRR